MIFSVVGKNYVERSLDISAMNEKECAKSDVVFFCRIVGESHKGLDGIPISLFDDYVHGQHVCRCFVEPFGQAIGLWMVCGRQKLRRLERLIDVFHKIG
ncbi:hypothetical protein AVEN_66707-1 [Araneus ventricosus]|uniref:Uncharacterized protein n=1 Tax=Araneus ventricosus TaxID=182803 RepID=A0A4Y2UZA0_ARAVE|nr:hypothetical protein AVEN_66707-1 [Araneus ventricosus]